MKGIFSSQSRKNPPLFSPSTTFRIRRSAAHCTTRLYVVLYMYTHTPAMQMLEIFFHTPRRDLVPCFPADKDLRDVAGVRHIKRTFCRPAKRIYIFLLVLLEIARVGWMEERKEGSSLATFWRLLSQSRRKKPFLIFRAKNKFKWMTLEIFILIPENPAREIKESYLNCEATFPVVDTF